MKNNFVENIKDENYKNLEENFERLQDVKMPGGKKLEVIPLPMPSPVYFEGMRLPASYANFYICNNAVLVPTFNDPNDRIALNILSELFTDRKVIGIHSVDLVWGLGTLHCLSHEEPAQFIYMSYYFIANIKINNESEYQKYLDEVDNVFDKFNGRYLALDKNPLILEGDWNYSRTVIIEFQNKSDFDDWYYSDEYQRIFKFRINAADCDTILVKGK